MPYFIQPKPPKVFPAFYKRLQRFPLKDSVVKSLPYTSNSDFSKRIKVTATLLVLFRKGMYATFYVYLTEAENYFVACCFIMDV